MAKFEIQGPDGKTYEVEAGSMEEAAAALSSFAPAPAGGSAANKPAVNDFRNRLTVLGANAANSMAFGLGDEAEGVRAGIKSMVEGEGFMPAYRAERDATRAEMATVNERFPVMATTGQVAGAMAPALAMAPLATGKTALEIGLRGFGLGAAEGAAQGAGNADGRSVGWEAIKGALIGGGAGVAAPAIVGGARAALNAVADPATGFFGIASRSKANRALAGAVERSGKSVGDLDALLAAARSAGQPEFRIVDALGLPGQRMASGIVRAGSAPGDEVAEFLATRQSGQPERVGAFVEDAFNVGGTTAAKTREGLVETRRATAKSEFDAAEGNAAPVDVRPAVGILDSTIGKMSGSGLEPPRVVAEFQKLRSKLAGATKEGNPTTLSDYNSVLALWREVKDDIDTAFASGNGSIGEALKPVRDALEASLADSSDMFRKATANYRSASGVIDAVDEGAMMATKGRAADNVPRFGAMAAAEQDAARVGYGDRLLAQLEGMTAPTANRAKPLQSPKRTAEAEAMATDFPLFSDRLARENTMWETQNRALGGSRTADNLADTQAVDGFTTGTRDAARSALNLQLGDAVAKVAAALGPMAKGHNEATRRLIAEALLSSNAGSALAPAIRQATTGKGVRRIIEALIRQPMREGGETLVQ